MANTPEGAKKSGQTRAKKSLLRRHAEAERSAATKVSPDEALGLLLMRELGVGEALRRMREGSVEPPPLELGLGDLLLPETDAAPPTMIHRPRLGSGTIGILGDTHVPYQDNQAIRTAFEVFKRRGVTGVCLNGDIADFYQASKYAKAPGMRSFKSEVDRVRQFVEAVAKTFAGTEIVYQTGNHDERLSKWLIRNEGMLYGLPSLELPYLLGLNELGIRFAPVGDSLSIGGLNVIHGDVLPGGGQINSARNLALKFLTPVAVNHWHIVDTWEGRSRVDGSEKISAYNIGCLCSKRADYSPKSTFMHGCMVVEYTPTEFRATNYAIDGAGYSEIRRKT